MPSPRFERIEALFHGALERPPDERDAWLYEQCGGDPDLLAEVVKLVVAASAEILLGREEAQTERTPPTQIGAYRIVREIGQGGMGSVYLAVHQGEGFEKTVALKLLRSGVGGELLRRRLLAERHILSGLEHPGIAQLFDGGTTDDGQPYLVLEYVEGETLLDYCSSRDLGTAARLDLLLKVCEAVHYAHQRLVVHRDLKPGNILVTPQGQPKLLDFGIAKLLVPRLAGEAGTVTSLRWMTPEYASPEQVRGDTVTTATDVYSLGVILYELLAGRKPYRVTTGGAHEIERAILEQEPARPSTAAASAKLRRLLRGDLDRVVLKALDKDPARRYATAFELGDDLRRFLTGMPVRAQADSLGYRAGKFVRRHRASMAAAAIAVVALVAGLAVAVVQAERARASAVEAERQRELAERRFTDVRALANTFLFEFHDAIVDVAGATEARALVLRRGVEFLDKLAGESAQNPELQDELARSYLRLASVQGATIYAPNVAAREGPLRSLEKALRLAEATHASQPGVPRYGSTLVQALIAQGSWRLKRGEADAAGAAFVRALTTAEAALERQPQDLEARERAIKTNVLAGLHLHMHAPLDQAAVYYRRALALAQDPLPAWRRDARSSPAEEECLSWLHFLAGHAERWQEALEIAQALERLASVRVAGNPQSPDARRSLGIGAHDIGWACLGLGRAREALSHLDRALSIYQRLASENPTDRLPPQDAARSREIRGDALAALGRHAEALADFERARAVHEAALADEPTNVFVRSRAAWVLRRHGETWLAAGRAPGPASAGLERALRLLEENLARNPKATFDRLNRARILSTLARLNRDADRHQAALTGWRELARDGVLPPSESGREAAEVDALAALAARPQPQSLQSNTTVRLP